MSNDLTGEALRWWRERMGSLFGFGNTHNGKRDYNLEFGYPGRVSTEDLYRMYKRNGIASRIVRGYPQATWEEQPVVRDEAGDSEEEKLQGDRNNEAFSPFVKDVNDFMRRTNALRYLERADRLSSIGRFGILLMGFLDGQRLDRPLQPGKRPLIYLQAYGEPVVKIVEYVRDPTDERFGKPLLYEVSPNREQREEGSAGPSQSSFKVHASRCLHLAEFLDDGEVAGTPRLEPVYNHLLDLEKVMGSAAETFWRNSNPGLALSADAEAKLDADALKDMKEQAAEFENGMRRILAMQGITASTLGAGNQTADPSTSADKLIDLIAGGTGYPKRLLIGSERGELASSQDSDSWASRIDERQNNYAGPGILSPFIQTMINTGNLKKPEGRFWVVWPESNALSPKDQAEVGRIRAETLAKYASSPNAEMIVPPQEFRRDFLQLPPETEFELPEEEELPEDDLDAEGNPITPVDEGGDDEEGDSTKQPAINYLVASGRVIGTNLRVRVGPKGMTIMPTGKANAAPRTLYVRRDLINADDVRKHFKAQGLEAMIEAEKMHVTIAFSRSPVDWFKVGTAWTTNEDGSLVIPPGGARMLELLGSEKDVLVQLFASSELSWRHEDIKLAGASWDYPQYQPHVSLTWDLGEDVQERMDRLEKLTPYTGRLVFGPEVFEEVKVDWRKTIRENSRA